MTDRKPKAYILGAGPAGLVAAHAATLKGYDVEIGTNQLSPSQITGAQYLDRYIPGITEREPDGQIKFYKRGTAAGYAQKIYNNVDAPTSWDKYDDEGMYDIWYLRDVYSAMWERYKSRMFKMEVDANVMASFMDTDSELIVVALPLKAICSNADHAFLSQEVTVYPGFPTDVGKKYEHLKDDQSNWILYNGKKKTVWYRCSRINHGDSVEVSGHYTDGHMVTKPLATTCDCWKEVPRVVLVGRYGTWDKNELVSGAWERVLDAHYAVQ